MKQSMSSRSQPLLFAITTNGFVRDNIFDAQYEYACGVLDGTIDDDRFAAFIYELDDRDEWTDETCWIKANPGLGTIKKFDFLKRCVEKAKADPSFLPTVLTKDFNLKETGASSWLRWDELNNDATFEDRFDYCVGGFDAADTTDLNAAKALMMRPDDPNIYVLSKYWIPEDLIEKRVKEDHIPYDVWVEKGYIEAIPGKKIHPKYITKWFLHIRDDLDIYPYYIGYDSWAAEYWVEEMSNYFGKDCMIPVIQGKKTLSVPMYELKAEFQDGKIIYNNNPVDKWCLANTSVDIDRNGNIQPHKGKSRLKRIDGTAALIDCYTVYHNKEAEYLSVI